MEKLDIFAGVSILLVVVSFRSLIRWRGHGVTRFFAWEGMAWLLVSNLPFWFRNPFGVVQLFSWLILFISIYLAVAGAILLKKKGNTGKPREDQTLFAFEKTTELVETGIYRYIRHPLYSSLLFLTWGIFLKNPAPVLIPVSLFSTLMLYLTAVKDEKECLEYFGKPYVDYMKKTRMFIPFVF
jgi:protein-S-isoprenylcysteine O-methyltransferase Ste14